MHTSGNKKTIWGVFLLVMIGVLMMALWQIYAKSSADSHTNETPNTPGQILKHLTPKEAHALIQQRKGDENFVILDVRTPQEFGQGYIEGAQNLDFYAKTFRTDLEKLDKTKTYLVYCRSGNRSRKTLSLMGEMKFNQAYNITGGIGEWYRKNLPITK